MRAHYGYLKTIMPAWVKSHPPANDNDGYERMMK